jgi:hypothetical protein
LLQRADGRVQPLQSDGSPLLSDGSPLLSSAVLALAGAGRFEVGGGGVGTPSCIGWSPQQDGGRRHGTRVTRDDVGVGGVGTGAG